MMITVISMSKLLVSKNIIVIPGNTCDIIPYVHNAEPSTIVTRDDTIVTYTCFPGHVMPNNQSSDSIQCMKGTWNSSVEDCHGKIEIIIINNNHLLRAKINIHNVFNSQNKYLDK